MKISNNNFIQININKNYNNNLYKKNTNYYFNNSLNSINNQQNINFKGNLNKNFFIKLFNLNPIYNFKKFNKKEFLNLSENQKQKLRVEYLILEKNLPAKITSIGKIHDFASECIKKVFDKRFGENNYIVLPLGRSLSSIGKALALKIGEENVINIPMSNAKRFFTEPYLAENYNFCINNIQKSSGLKSFKEFLSSKKLSKKDIKKSNKNYILLDYCCSGYSLRGAEQLFKSDIIWGNQKNIYAADFIKILENFENKNYNLKLISELKNILLNSYYKDFSFVDASKKLKDTKKAYKKPNNRLGNITKLIWFHIIDTIVSKKNNFNTTLKILSKKQFELPIHNQKVELWQDSKSQFKSDITNNLNELNKILSNKKFNSFNKQNDIKQIHKFLSECYKTPTYENIYYYYQIKEDIEKIIATKINIINIL